jgi:RimJ/RimL family protein N-acetyltransferase
MPFTLEDAPFILRLLKRDFLDAIDIGYALLPEFCGAGYAFEATSAVLDYARNQLDARRVVAIAAAYNEWSINSEWWPNSSPADGARSEAQLR